MELRKHGYERPKSPHPDTKKSRRQYRKRHISDDDDDDGDGDGERANAGTSWREANSIHRPWTSSRVHSKPSSPMKSNQRKQEPAEEPSKKNRVDRKPGARAATKTTTAVTPPPSSSSSRMVLVKKQEMLSSPGRPVGPRTRIGVAAARAERCPDSGRRMKEEEKAREPAEPLVAKSDGAVRPATPRGGVRRSLRDTPGKGKPKVEEAARSEERKHKQTEVSLKYKSVREARKSKSAEDAHSSRRELRKKDGDVSGDVKPPCGVKLKGKDGNAVGKDSEKDLKFSEKERQRLGAEEYKLPPGPATEGVAKPAGTPRSSPVAESHLKVPAKKRSPSVASERPKIQFKIAAARSALVPGADREGQGRVTGKKDAELHAKKKEQEVIPTLLSSPSRARESMKRKLEKSSKDRGEKAGKKMRAPAPCELQEGRANVAVVPPFVQALEQLDWEMSAVETETATSELHDPLPLPVVDNERIGHLCDMEVDLPTQSLGTTEPCRLHVVLDTNVLLHDLPLVHKLRQRHMPGLGAPVLLVPWVVLQELDSLKDGRGVSRGAAGAARGAEAGGETAQLVGRAVRYVHDCLARRVPRLRGQSVQQASQRLRGLREECNDDRVLQCVLQCQEQHPSAHTLLLTNDKNLCSKALVSGANACTVQDLAVELCRMAEEDEEEEQDGSASPERVALPDPARQLAAEMDRSVVRAAERTPVTERTVDPAGCKRKVNSDQLTWRIQHLLHTEFKDALAAIVEEEMKLAFDELWLDIVCIPPPYTLAQALKCLSKHWFSVFGLVVCRHLQGTVTALQKQQHKYVWGGKDVADAHRLGTSLDHALAIVQEFEKRSDYGGSVPRARAALLHLKGLFEQTVANKKAVAADERAANEAAVDGVVAQAAGTGNAPTVAEGPAVAAVAPGADRTTANGDPWEIFEDVWKAVTQCKEAICGYAEQLSDGAGVSAFAQPDWAFLQQLVSAVQTLSSCIIAVLESNCSGQSITELCIVLQGFINCEQLRLRQCTPTPQSLFQCLFAPHQREKLERGCAQLQEVAIMLERARQLLLPHAQLAGWS